MQNDYLFNQQTTTWFRTKTFKLVLTILAILAIAAVVLFSEQIGDLLELWGLKAATESRTIVIDGLGEGDNHSFFEGSYSVDPTDSIIIDENNRLILNAE